MTKPNLDFGDFAMAPRRGHAKADDTPAIPVAQPHHHEDVEIAPQAEVSRKQRRLTVLPRLPEEEQNRIDAQRMIEQENARSSLKALKRAKQRDAKFYVNVPLDQATKGRLARASLENSVKMTSIMQAAIDTYLSENGY